MSKLTPPAPAGWLNDTVKVAVVVPALPSFTETSLMLNDGTSSLTMVPVALLGEPTTYPLPALRVITTVSSGSDVASAVGSMTMLPLVCPAGITSGEFTAAKSVPDVAVPPMLKPIETAVDDGLVSVTV